MLASFPRPKAPHHHFLSPLTRTLLMANPTTESDEPGRGPLPSEPTSGTKAVDEQYQVDGPGVDEQVAQVDDAPNPVEGGVSLDDLRNALEGVDRDGVLVVLGKLKAQFDLVRAFFTPRIWSDEQ